MQVVLPHVAYALSGNALGTILNAAHSSILLHLSAMGKSQSRFVSVQPSPTTYPAKRGSPSQACRVAAYSSECRIGLEVGLAVAEEVQVVLWVRAPKAGVLHAVLVLLLLLLLLQLGLLVDRLREVGEGVGQVVAGEAAPVWWHRGRPSKSIKVGFGRDVVMNMLAQAAVDALGGGNQDLARSTRVPLRVAG